MRKITSFLLLVSTACIVGCAARRTTIFVHPEYDFGLVERVAVVSFENLSTEQGVAGYATRLFMTELLAAQAFDVVEPGETGRIIRDLNPTRGGELDLESLRRMRDSLQVQAVIFGSVGEAAAVQGRGATGHVVSIDARMVDCTTGSTVWSAAVSTGQPSSVSKMLGTGETSRSDAVQRAVRKLVRSLLE